MAGVILQRQKYLFAVKEKSFFFSAPEEKKGLKYLFVSYFLLSGS